MGQWNETNDSRAWGRESVVEINKDRRTSIT